MGSMVSTVKKLRTAVRILWRRPAGASADDPSITMLQRGEISELLGKISSCCRYSIISNFTICKEKLYIAEKSKYKKRILTCSTVLYNNYHKNKYSLQLCSNFLKLRIVLNTRHTVGTIRWNWLRITKWLFSRKSSDIATFYLLWL